MPKRFGIAPAGVGIERRNLYRLVEQIFGRQPVALGPSHWLPAARAADLWPPIVERARVVATSDSQPLVPAARRRSARSTPWPAGRFCSPAIPRRWVAAMAEASEMRWQASWQDRGNADGGRGAGRHGNRMVGAQAPAGPARRGRKMARRHYQKPPNSTRSAVSPIFRAPPAGKKQWRSQDADPPVFPGGRWQWSRDCRHPALKPKRI